MDITTLARALARAQATLLPQDASLRVRVDDDLHLRCAYMRGNVTYALLVNDPGPYDVQALAAVAAAPADPPEDIARALQSDMRA